MLPINQAVLLVGGIGKRLGEKTINTPKPLLPVAKRPFIEYWFQALSIAGIKDIILSCGYLSQQFIHAYNNTLWEKSRIRCFVESTPAGTGGALTVLHSHLDKQFFLINGDSFLFPDWHAINKELNNALPKCLGILTLISKNTEKRYGSVLSSSNGEITAFAEKEANNSYPFINGGVYAFRKEITHHIKFGESLEYDILPMLANARQLRGVHYAGDFIDIGIPKDYERAQTKIPTMIQAQK